MSRLVFSVGLSAWQLWLYLNPIYDLSLLSLLLYQVESERISISFNIFNAYFRSGKLNLNNIKYSMDLHVLDEILCTNDILW